jgi:alcohol dehydrogenase
MLVRVPDKLDAATVASASDNIVDGWRTVGPQLEAEPGAPVLVVGGAGPGSIGLYAAGLAVAAGAERVVYVDAAADEGRLAVARELGAETPDADPLPERLGTFPITVDASADADGLLLALRSTAADGICTSTGIYFTGGPTLPLLEMYVKNTTFVTGRCHARPAMPRVLELAAGGHFHPEQVTSSVVGWHDAIDALTEGGWTKLVIARD